MSQSPFHPLVYPGQWNTQWEARDGDMKEKYCLICLNSSYLSHECILYRGAFDLIFKKKTWYITKIVVCLRARLMALKNESCKNTLLWATYSIYEHFWSIKKYTHSAYLRNSFNWCKFAFSPRVRWKDQYHSHVCTI